MTREKIIKWWGLDDPRELLADLFGVVIVAVIVCGFAFWVTHCG